jgi:hypothetical protein
MIRPCLSTVHPDLAMQMFNPRRIPGILLSFFAFRDRKTEKTGYDDDC